MAWNPSPKVANCRDIARKYKKEQVIILMVDHKEWTLESASYGKTKVLCDDAKRLADLAHKAIIDEILP